MRMTTRNIYLSIASVLVAVGAVVALNVMGTNSQAVSSYRNCADDTIIRCGAITEAELLQKYDANVGDVQSIYSHYGISRSDLAGQTSQIKHGTVYQDGRVVVDGKTVATDAYSLSRVRFSSQSKTVTINGTTYYQGPNMSIFVRAVDVYVYMRNGQFYRAVISSCGNPLMATPVKPPVQPSYSCDSLKATKIDRTKFQFTSSATAKNGAEIVNYTYDFGDGNKQTVNGTTVSHTYAKPGTYTATVTVTIKVDGQTKTVTGQLCKVVVEVKPVPVTPTYACDDLTFKKITRTEYEFTAAASAENGAEIVSYTYDFGDGNKQTVTGTTVSHTYANTGTYTVKMSVNVKVDGETKVVTSADCQVTIKVEEKPVTPSYACDSLKAHKINRTTYQFTTDASAENGAEIVNYTYDFGDGTTRTAEDATINHTYAKPGDYTIKVSVSVKVDGENCQTTVEVEKVPVTPAYACDDLTIKRIGKRDNAYAYTLTYTAENGATLQKVTYDFGDDTTETYGADDATDVEHTYAGPGTYTTVATLYFDVEDGESTVEKTIRCEVSVTISEEMCPVPGKEHLPKGAECDKTPETPQTPPELPQTGIGSLLSGGLGLGSLTAAGYYWASSRRSLLDALLNR